MCYIIRQKSWLCNPNCSPTPYKHANMMPPVGCCWKGRIHNELYVENWKGKHLSESIRCWLFYSLRNQIHKVSEDLMINDFDITRKIPFWLQDVHWFYGLVKSFHSSTWGPFLFLPSLMQQDFEGLMTDAAARYQSQALLGKLRARTLQLMNTIQRRNDLGCIRMYETTSNMSDKMG